MKSLIDWKSEKPKTDCVGLIRGPLGHFAVALFDQETGKWRSNKDGEEFNAPSQWAEIPTQNDSPPLEITDPMAQVMDIGAMYEGGEEWNRKSVLRMGDFLQKLANYCYKEGRNMEPTS